MSISANNWNTLSTEKLAQTDDQNKNDTEKLSGDEDDDDEETRFMIAGDCPSECQSPLLFNRFGVAADSGKPTTYLEVGSL